MCSTAPRSRSSTETSYSRTTLIYLAVGRQRCWGADGLSPVLRLRVDRAPEGHFSRHCLECSRPDSCSCRGNRHERLCKSANFVPFIVPLPEPVEGVF